MDPFAIDGRLPLCRFVLFFADDASGDAQELFGRLEGLGLTGRLYNDACLLALEADEYKRTELAVSNSQYWFVYATDSFFAECGFLEQHRGELLARTALNRGGRWANRLIPIYCKPKPQYRRLAWGFSALSGLNCRDRHFEAAVTGLFKSSVAENMWRELETQWLQAQRILQAEEACRQQQLELQLELKLKTLVAPAAAAAKVGADACGTGGHVAVAGLAARADAVQVMSNAHGPAPVIYNININAQQSTVQVGDSNAMHYSASSVPSYLHPTSTVGVTIDASSSITAAEGLSNDEVDEKGDEANCSVCCQAGAPAQLLSAQSTGEPLSVVDSSLPLIGSGSDQLPLRYARPASGAVEDSSTGGFSYSEEGSTTALAEEIVDRSMTVTLHGPYSGVPNSEIIVPYIGEARAIPVARIEPYRIVPSADSRTAGTGVLLEGGAASPQPVNAASSTATSSARDQHEGTAV